MAGRCSSKRPVHSSHTKREDVRFEAQSEKDIQMEELMASMKSMGMGANLYNREDMMGKMADGYGDEDEDGSGMGMGQEDEEDEEDEEL